MRRGSRDYRIPWGSNCTCDVCGIKYKRHEMRKRWDGLMVCNADYEVRHPQDFVKGIADRQTPPIIRDQVEPIYISIGKPDGSKL